MEHYHLCPFCGQESKGTSVICPEHYPVVFSGGKIIAYTLWHYLSSGSVSFEIVGLPEKRPNVIPLVRRVWEK